VLAGQLLPGWEQTTTWGHDIDHLYAQVIRNGVSDDVGPEFWITPPRYPAYNHEHELEFVLCAMTAGVDLDRQPTIHYAR
jgi:hypothetical protein